MRTQIAQIRNTGMSMEKIKKILAPTDLSELSRPGVRHALEFARAVGAKVTVYHVISLNELVQLYNEVGKGLDAGVALHAFHHPLETSCRALNRFLKRHFSDLISAVEVEEKVEMGAPDKNIVMLAEEEESDLIVISTHGRTGLSRMLVGSVTEKVVRHAPCPVLSIHPEPKNALREKSKAVGQGLNTLV
ncbi:MAG: universal stress protein [Candidatus Binatia bacterium]